jgi:phosphoribosyl 1,2-cyclic phosphodiesterase
MKITIWGCRGSLPTPGTSTLKYGGNTTCISIESRDGHLLIIDAGTGLRSLGKKLMREKNPSEIHLLLTHSHWDHLMGFPFFLPVYSPRFTLRFCRGHELQHSIRPYLETQLLPPYSPIDSSFIKARFLFDDTGFNERARGSIAITPIPLNHPNGGVGFKFVEANRSFVFLTDNELGHSHVGGLERNDYVEFCRGVDLLIHDAQYTEEEIKLTRGWGHSTYGEAADLAIDAGVRQLGLFHHDPDRDDNELENQTRWCQERIQNSGRTVECFAVAENAIYDL